MKKKSKLKITSMPRFVKMTVMALMILIMIVMTAVTVLTHITTAFNGEKEKSVISSNPADHIKDEATIVAENQEAAEALTKDSVESIKSRLRSGDTAGIKVVFLTFDDGPSENTGEVLDILNTSGVKATFFTTRHTGVQAETFYRRIVDEGHTLANHTCSHDFALYSNPEAFYADIEVLDAYQRQVTGLTETSHIFRFPGGSANANETCALGIVKQGFNYADWNVTSGDGSANPPTREIVAKNIIEGCRKYDVSVVLCHAEIKPDTRAALATVIKTLKAEGYTFLAMENDFTYPRQLEI